MISQRPAYDRTTWVSHVAMHVASHVATHAVAKVELGSTFAMSRCDSLRQLATGVSPVAKPVATHVAAIFHTKVLNWASASRTFE